MSAPSSVRKRSAANGKRRKDDATHPSQSQLKPQEGDGKTWLRVLFLAIAVVCLYFAASDFWSTTPPPPLIPDTKEPPPFPFELPPPRSLPSERITSASETQQAAVIEAFQHSWSAYVRDAWGYDEYHPLSQHGTNLGHVGMGYTIVDSLDTLILMGLPEDYALARDWVRDELSFNVSGRMNVFETTIRTLGGLLSASALIRNPPHPAIASSEEDSAMFLRKAVELADRLLPAFETPTGIPLREVDLETGQAFPDVDNNNSSSLAEATTLQLEFKYLAHLTGDRTYWRVAERPMQVVRRATAQMKQYHGLLPIFLDPMNGYFYTSDIRLGSRGDSYYEYLIKQHLQTGEGVYKEMYTYALEGIKQVLIKPSVKSKPPLLFTAELTPRKGPDGRPALRLLPKQDHLVCFLGGAMMLASEHAEEDWRIGHELIRTCVDTYMKTATRLAPEIVFFRTPQDPLRKEADWFIKNYGERPNPLIDARNILRPETVESLYIAFHLTGDQIYRDWGWQIFEAFVKHCKVESGGFASIDDVDSLEPNKLDRMETFWLSETLKYLYLLFSDQSLLSLSDWVMNTEAHPLPVFQSSFETNVK